MQKAIKDILLDYRDINVQVEKIMELVADRTDLEKIQIWRQKYYTLKETNERIRKKIKKQNEQLHAIQDILKYKN